MYESNNGIKFNVTFKTQVELSAYRRVFFSVAQQP
jgi:hypothetical protein